MITIVLFAIGFVLLAASADWLVKGSSALARRIKVSDLFIGLTVVAFGTSTPELFVNLFASARGNAEIAIGNVVGSNIFNILLILGVSSLIYPLSVTRGTVWREIPFSLLAAILLGALANDALFDMRGDSSITRIDGFVLIILFVVFLYYLVSGRRNSDFRTGDAGEGDIPLWRSIALIAAGLAGLMLGSRWVVDGAVSIAARIGVSESFIGLTIVAAGTSLPELATSAVAAYRKNPDIAVGNIVGSNIFNIFFILALSSLINPLPVMPRANGDILVLIGASLLLFFSMFTGRRRHIDRWEGVLFVVLYLAYLAFCVTRG